MRNVKIEYRRHFGPVPALVFFHGIVLLAAMFLGCSSVPKKPVEDFTNRNLAANQLNLANQTASRGYYSDALLILEEARRITLGTDDPALRIKTSTTRANILFSMGRHDEAFSEWDSAANEADASNETVLAALARVYSIRARLVLFAAEDSGTDADVQDYKTQVSRIMGSANDPVLGAAGNLTLGMADKQLKRWTDAENSVKKASEFHEKNFSLEDAAYDWFIIASIRSMAGNLDASLDALKSAINFDRRAENGFGLASSWQAMGDVYKKANRDDDSRAAWRRAADIYRAMGHDDRADKLEAQL